MIEFEYHLLKQKLFDLLKSPQKPYINSIDLAILIEHLANSSDFDAYKEFFELSVLNCIATTNQIEPEARKNVFNTFDRFAWYLDGAPSGELLHSSIIPIRFFSEEYKTDPKMGPYRSFIRKAQFPKMSAKEASVSGGDPSTSPLTRIE